MKDKTTLSPALLRRLPVYFRALINIYGKGKQRTSSQEIAAEMKIASSQVRADMKALGCTGQRSYGYSVPTLYKTIGDCLQLFDKVSAVIVGNTPIAETLKSTQVFSVRGIKLAACLEDVSCTEKLERLCAETHPNIIILASESNMSDKVLAVCESVCKTVSEIWNFSGKDLYSDKLKVKNIHISDLLMLLCSEVVSGPCRKNNNL